MPDPRHILGQRGEAAVAHWLAARGWRVLARRWRGQSGELDVVALDPDGVLVAVEVKVRRSARAGSAVEAVDRRRAGRLRRALAEYAGCGPMAFADQRLDLVTLEPAPDARVTDAPATDAAWLLRHQAAIDRW